MKLVELLQPSHILLDLQETKRTTAIHKVASLLEKDEGVTHFQGFYDELLARERVEATSLGNGVAFPCANRSCETPCFGGGAESSGRKL